MEIQAVIKRHMRPAEDADFVQAGELFRRVLDKTGMALSFRLIEKWTGSVMLCLIGDCRKIK